MHYLCLMHCKCRTYVIPARGHVYRHGFTMMESESDSNITINSENLLFEGGN